MALTLKPSVKKGKCETSLIAVLTILLFFLIFSKTGNEKFSEWDCSEQSDDTDHDPHYKPETRHRQGTILLLRYIPIHTYAKS